MELKEGCFREVNDKLIVFREKRSKLTIVNESRESFKKVQVDECQITEGVRCDCALINDRIECYIELKGQDERHACEQIESTIKAFCSDFKKTKKICFIICTKVPRIDAGRQVMMKKFRMNYNATLIVQSSGYTYKI